MSVSSDVTCDVADFCNAAGLVSIIRDDASDGSVAKMLASEILLILQSLMMDRRLFISLVNGLDERIPLMFSTKNEQKFCESPVEQKRLVNDLRKALLFSRYVVEKSKFDPLIDKFVNFLKDTQSKIEKFNILELKKRSRLRKKYPVYEIYATANLIYALLVRFVNNAEKLLVRCQELGITGKLCENVLTTGFIKESYIAQWCSPTSLFDIRDYNFRCFVMRPPCDTCSRHYQLCDSKQPICSFCATLEKHSCITTHRLLCCNSNTSEGNFPLIATSGCAKQTANHNDFSESKNPDEYVPLSVGAYTDDEFVEIYTFLITKLPTFLIADNICTSAAIQILITPKVEWISYSLLSKTVTILDLLRLEFPKEIPTPPEIEVNESDVYVKLVCGLQEALVKFRSVD